MASFPAGTTLFFLQVESARGFRTRNRLLAQWRSCPKDAIGIPQTSSQLDEFSLVCLWSLDLGKMEYFQREVVSNCRASAPRLSVSYRKLRISALTPCSWGPTVASNWQHIFTCSWADCLKYSYSVFAAALTSSTRPLCRSATFRGPRWRILFKTHL